MFEQASRCKLRLGTHLGLLNTEDLWDFPLEGLDGIAKDLNKVIKESETESFIEKESSVRPTLALSFEIVKHIIKVRLDEADKAEKAAERRQKRQEILHFLAAKKTEEMAGKSEEELLKELESLNLEPSV